MTVRGSWSPLELGVLDRREGQERRAASGRRFRTVLPRIWALMGLVELSADLALGAPDVERARNESLVAKDPAGVARSSGEVTPRTTGDIGLSSGSIPSATDEDEASLGSGFAAAPHCEMPAPTDPLVVLACSAQCSGAEICLRADTGAPLCGPLPSRVDVGSKVLVKVIGPAGCRDAVRLGTASALQARRVAREPGSSNTELVTLAELPLRIGGADEHQAVSLRFARTGPGDPVEVEYRIPIERGGYCVGFGVLAPIVIDGDRQIRAVRVPGTNERRLRVVEDESVSLALSLNGYPFGGRRKGSSHACEGGPSFRCVGRLLGFQLAADLAFAKPAGRLYAGLLLEPVSGLGLGGGMALVRGEILEAGYAADTLVEDPWDLPVRHSYFLRGYVGVTISSGLAYTIGALRRSAGDL
ncbi:MAG: hypothetical protein JW751_29410 [Polyangiaceae bacterium]|nr:hypothetical protein [Polyangiaceae bacterium]